MHGLVIGLLPLAEIIKAEFVYRGGIDRPGMAQVPLLHARAEERSEPGNVSAGALEAGDWCHAGIILKIVVCAELLIGRNFLVEANCELIVVLVRLWNSRERPRSEGCNVIVVKRERRGIETLLGNHVVRKEGG